MSERHATDSPPATRLVPTGVPGLDDVLRGGLPAGYFYLVQGDPGVGKTTLGLQFLLACHRTGDRCLYVSMSETRAELLTVARSHGWSLDGIAVCDLTTLEAQLAEGRGGEAAGTSTLFHPADVELNQTVRVVTDEVNRVRPDRVVLDSLSELRMLAESPVRYRRQVLSLKQFFGRLGATVLLVENRNDQQADLHVQSIAHGVISLERIATTTAPSGAGCA
jgi:circadian clock protein KaiC